MREPVGLILAGGRASRMDGKAKDALMLGGQSLLTKCADRFDPQVSTIAISANHDIASHWPVLPDTMTGHLGPLAGILAGLDWAQSQGATHMVSVAVDTPFFPCDLTPRLIMAGLSHPNGFAIAATSDNQHATFGLWPVTLRAAMVEFLNNGGRKMRAFTTLHAAAIAPFEDTQAFFNINTPGDLTQAAAWM